VERVSEAQPVSAGKKGRRQVKKTKRGGKKKKGQGLTAGGLLFAGGPIVHILLNSASQPIKGGGKCQREAKGWLSHAAPTVEGRRSPRG